MDPLLSITVFVLPRLALFVREHPALFVRDPNSVAQTIAPGLENHRGHKEAAVLYFEMPR